MGYYYIHTYICKINLFMLFKKWSPFSIMLFKSYSIYSWVDPWTNTGLNCSATAAKSLHSCPTLCNLIDFSLPGSSIHGIFQARVLHIFVYIRPCLTLCSLKDCSPPGSSVHGIFQARIPEWVVISYSKEPSQLRDRTRVSCIFCIGSCILYHCATWEALIFILQIFK